MKKLLAPFCLERSFPLYLICALLAATLKLYGAGGLPLSLEGHHVSAYEVQDLETVELNVSPQHLISRGFLNNRSEALIGGKLWLPKPAYGLPRGETNLLALGFSYALGLSDEGRMVVGTSKGPAIWRPDYLGPDYIVDTQLGRLFLPWDMTRDGRVLGLLQRTNVLNGTVVKTDGFDPAVYDLQKVFRLLPVPGEGRSVDGVVGINAGGAPVSGIPLAGNSAGQIVGVIFGANAAADQYVLWNLGALSHQVLSGNVLEPQQPLGSAFETSLLASLNDEGDAIFGVSTYSTVAMKRPFKLYLAHDLVQNPVTLAGGQVRTNLAAGMHDARDLNPNTTLDLAEAAGINNRDAIAASFLLSGAFGPRVGGVWQLGFTQPEYIADLKGGFTTTPPPYRPRALNDLGQVLTVSWPAAGDPWNYTVSLASPALIGVGSVRLIQTNGGLQVLGTVTVTNVSQQPVSGATVKLLSISGQSSVGVGKTPLESAIPTVDLAPGGSFLASVRYTLQSTGRVTLTYSLAGTGGVSGTNAIKSVPFFEAFTLTGTSPLTARIDAIPARIGLGDNVEVHVVASNGSSQDITNVKLTGSLSLDGDAELQQVSGPTPTSIPLLAAGQSAVLTNFYTGTRYGHATLSGSVTGTLQGQPVTSDVVTSPSILVGVKGDLLIKRGAESSSQLGGNDEYQRVPAGAQIRTNVLGNDEASVFNVQIQNDEKTPQVFSVFGKEGSTAGGWKVQYLFQGQDLGGAVTNGVQLPQLAPGTSHFLTMRVVGTNAAPGDTHSIQLWLTSTNLPSETLDTVLAVTEKALEIVVNSTGDLPDKDPADCCCDTGRKLGDGSVECTLRAAIEFANKHLGKDIIKFKIPASDPNAGSGTPVIYPETALPNVTEPVIVDGFTQRGTTTAPGIELSGDKLTHQRGYSIFDFMRGPAEPSGLVIDAGSCEIRGLAIYRFPMAGLLLRGEQNAIQGNYIGLHASGLAAGANGYSLLYTTAGNISGRSVPGAGIAITSPGNLIGGTDATQRNVISGVQPTSVPGASTGPGILLVGAAATGNTVQGNLIGLDPTGTRLPVVPPNSGGSDVAIPLAGIFISDANENLIGGSEPSAGNCFAGNARGVWSLRGSGNEVLGNFFGTDLSGATRVKTMQTGVEIEGSEDLTVDGNTIGGPTGVRVTGQTNGVPNRVTNNRIGVTAGGGDLGLVVGVDLAGAGNLELIGNTVAYAETGMQIGVQGPVTIRSNEVAHSLNRGIWVSAKPASAVLTLEENHLHDSGLGQGFGVDVSGLTGVRLAKNRIYNSGSLGITRDGSAQPNTADAPVLFPVVNGSQAVRGKISTSLALSNNRTFQVEVFANHTSPRQYGEGELFLGEVDTPVDFAGEGSFSLDLPGSLSSGMFLSATATDPSGSTSEFSKAVQLCFGPDNDFDGICDDLEKNVPNRNGPRAASGRLAALATGTGDGNGDGIPDALQANVCSLIGGTGKWVTLAVASNLTLENVSAGAPIDLGLPSGYELPLGILSGTVSGFGSGASVNLTNYLHDAVNYTTVLVYGPSSENAQPHWFDLRTPGSPPLSAGAGQFSINVRDGGPGDFDHRADGNVVLIFAPAVEIPTGPALEVLSATLQQEDAYVLNADGTPNSNPATITVVDTVLAWAPSGAVYELETTSDLGATAIWQPTVGAPALLNGKNVVTISAAGAHHYYRLRKRN